MHRSGPPPAAPACSGGRRTTRLAVFALGALALTLPWGYAIGPALLLFGSAALLLQRPRLTFGRREWSIVALLLAYAAVGLWDAYRAGGPTVAWMTPALFVLAIATLLRLLASPPQATWLWSGLAVGGMASGGLAAWQTWIDGSARASGFLDKIQFGDLGLLTGMWCLAGLGWAVGQPRARSWWALLLAGAGLGTLASLLSGTRGGWLAMPLLGWVLYLGYGRHLTRRWLVGLTALALVVAVSVYATPQFGVQERVQRLFSSYTEFVEENDPTNSVGGRLEMWRGALILIPEKPWLGWGDAGYARARDRLIARGALHPSLARFTHVHNEILDAWLKRGIVGLVALLALYLVPLWLFAPYLRHPDLSLRALATAGALLPVAYLGFGLTQVFLAGPSGAALYAFWLVVWWASLRQRERVLLACPARA